MSALNVIFDVVVTYLYLITFLEHLIPCPFFRRSAKENSHVLISALFASLKLTVHLPGSVNKIPTEFAVDTCTR